MPRGSLQVPKRELPPKLLECRKHDALDVYDSKEFPILHGRDGTSNLGRGEEVLGIQKLKQMTTILAILLTLALIGGIIGIAFFPVLMS